MRIICNDLDIKSKWAVWVRREKLDVQIFRG